MKISHYALLCASILSLLTISGCDDSEKKTRQAEREKAKAQEEATRRSLQNHAGNYTPAPIDMSMTPKPAAPTAGSEGTPKEAPAQ